MSESEESPAPPRTIPAATLVVFRRGAAGQPPELLMVQRAKGMRFAGGMAVFPGGRIDPSDYELAASLAPGATLTDDPDDGPARVAAIRETLEETGLLLGIDRPATADEAIAARRMLEAQGALAPVLAHFGWRLVLDRLVPFARWCPQRDNSFDTHFFLTDLGSGQVDLLVDATENTHLFWASAAGALDMDAAGEISVIFPTRRNLDRLALFADYDEAVAHARAWPIRSISAFIEERHGEPYLCIPEGLGYPVTEQPMSTVRRS